VLVLSNRTCQCMAARTATVLLPPSRDVRLAQLVTDTLMRPGFLVSSSCCTSPVIWRPRLAARGWRNTVELAHLSACPAHAFTVADKPSTSGKDQRYTSGSETHWHAMSKKGKKWFALGLPGSLA
jgi:hypothetical protein